jgi:hypothetical protein
MPGKQKKEKALTAFKSKNWWVIVLLVFINTISGCQNESPDPGNGGSQSDEFYFGADLSYVNQILDHGGN